jgi:nucleotide-binding universal stress UspA family protein
VRPGSLCRTPKREAPRCTRRTLHTTYLQATTTSFLAIVACQVGTAFAARREHASLRHIGVTTNRLLLAGIAFELAFAAFVVLVPGVHEALGMQLPPTWMLGLLLDFPVLVWAPDEVLRAVLRRRSAASQRRSARGDRQRRQDQGPTAPCRTALQGEGAPVKRETRPTAQEVVMSARTGRVVVGYDASEHGRRAVLWAADEAAHRRASLEVVHAADYRGLGLRGPAVLARAWARTAREDAHDVAVEGAAIARLAVPDLVVHIACGVGAPVPLLVQESQDADLLVLGAHGQGREAAEMLGPIADPVGKRAAPWC